jgi:type IV secretion system protein TrbC
MMMKKPAKYALAALAAAPLLDAVQAMAASTTANLPWEAPLKTIQNSVTGPAGLSVSIIALTGSGAMMAFGGEMGEMTRRLCLLAMAISIIVLADGFMTSVFPSATGALIG